MNRDRSGPAAGGGDRHRFPHLPAESWELFLADRLPEPSTRRLEEHVARCPECRSVLERADPTRVFSRLRALEVRPESWEGFWEELAPRLVRRPARTASPAAGETAGPPSRGGLALAAGAAAALALVLGLAVMVGAPSREAGVPATGEEACPPRVAALGLTLEECLALHGHAIVPAGPPEVIIRPDLDLRGL